MRILLIGLIGILHFGTLGQDSLLYKEAYTVRYENDLFTGTDRYYSQGIFLQYDHSDIDLNWLNRFFFRVPDIQRGLQTGVAQKVYTPSSITSDSLLPGDRPYAATYGYTARFSSQSRSKNYTLSWSLNTGWLGKPAFGKETQTAIHRWTHNTKPLGWQHQLHNGLIFNLGFGIMKTWFAKTKWVRAEIGSVITLGSLTNETRVSGSLKLGYITGQKQFLLYYNQEARAVAYDGTLQGGLFTKPDEARIASKEITRLVSEQELGLKVLYKHFSCAAYMHFQSKLFEGAANHRWGGISLSYYFGTAK
ncbi:lipid A deacylase LpxR family protein [Fluviicola chungangensis]|uniref:Lipid A deacylase LpxR family protein n=1 Tax=Fluviicola chungangensis TaxID=2597671 RepID=A0A556MY76_9FLAO|nr:lipid A deacylase LpxR family protein [Fluviicola chungangensis]TSJ44870.1 lipid A deacylase LpxR family protein [Fluviicola chungangensis]